jgi:hypothetical protein
MPFKNKSDLYRAKALACEHCARETSDPTSKRDWEELAIDWHTMANFAARAEEDAALKRREEEDSLVTHFIKSLAGVIGRVGK